MAERHSAVGFKMGKGVESPRLCSLRWEVLFLPTPLLPVPFTPSPAHTKQDQKGGLSAAGHTAQLCVPALGLIVSRRPRA